MLVSECEPAASEAVVIAHIPLATVALPTAVLPSDSVTRSPLAPLPVMTGVRTLVVPSPVTPVSLASDKARPEGAAGSVVSMDSES